jgi:hypothetical protein
MSGALGPHSKPVKNAARNEKDKKRRADGLQRHQHALAEKQAEIDHLHGSLTQVVGQMKNFRGVAQVIQDYYQVAIYSPPWLPGEREKAKMA